MHSGDLTSASAEPEALRVLSDEQKERLTSVLDCYLAQLEQGVPPDPSKLVAAHPDLAEPLRLYLDSLNDLQRVAAGFGPASSTAAFDVSEEENARRLGDFILGRELGRGGMGVVYEARQISLDRRVALKILPFAAVLDAKQIARFKNEAQAAAQLQHPNIVPVFAVGADRGVHYYAMQYIDGQPLDRIIRELRETDSEVHEPRNKARTLATAADQTVGASVVPAANSVLGAPSRDRRAFISAVIRIGVEAAHALHAAHEYGVVHRDIKPSNLLLDNRGKIWITDFGLARCQKDVTLTKTGDVVGTMRYMSPEQAQGQTALVDHRTDIYSLATTLYELLTLEPAVPGDEGPALLRTLVEREPVPMRKICADIPHELDLVVMKAMSRQRDERYMTAQQFAEDLQRVIDGEPTLAQPPTLGQRMRKWTRRHQRVVGAAVAVGLCAMLGILWSTLLIAREKRRAEENFLRAERHMQRAHDAVDRFGSQLAERLSDVPGAAHVRRELLLETLEFFREFAEEAADAPALRDDLALTYSKIGTLADENGSFDEALDAHRQALAIFRELVEQEPHEYEYWRRLALCQNNLGRTLHRAGQTAEAQRAYEDAIAILERLTASNVPGAESDLALPLTNLGLLQYETNRWPLAARSLAVAIELQEKQLTNRPNDPDLLRALAASLNNLSAIYLESAPAKAVQHYEAALRYQEQAALVRPANLRLKSDWALCYSNLGAARSRLGQYAEAAACYQQAIALQQQLTAAVPQQPSYLRDLAVSFNNHGLMQTKLGELSDAERSFIEALALQKDLVQLHPGDYELHSSLGGIYNNLGIVLEDLNRLEDAAAAYEQAVEHQRVAFEGAPLMAQYRSFLSKHYYNYGRALRRLGQPQEAIRSALARRELWPEDPQRLFAVAEELALAGRELQRFPGAGMSAEECAELTMEVLREAMALGLELPADWKSREAFALLRERPEFQQIAEQGTLPQGRGN